MKAQKVFDIFNWFPLILEKKIKKKRKKNLNLLMKSNNNVCFLEIESKNTTTIAKATIKTEKWSKKKRKEQNYE